MPSRYPTIYLRSKADIVKRISGNKFSRDQALEYINYAIHNFDKCWYDSKDSDPGKGKYVRSAARSRALREILSLFDKEILSVYDKKIPKFIYGGVSKKDNVKAGFNLIGRKKNRILLKLDVKNFFEQVSQERVFHFFYSKGDCTVEAATILSNLTCVSSGAKGSGSRKMVLARGFATSPRLAVWCNLDAFQRLDWKVRRMLKGLDPRVSIYVDDIGISASGVTQERMEEVKQVAIRILEKSDHNQPLSIHRNLEKTRIDKFTDGAEFVGNKLGRQKLSIGEKSQKKIRITQEQIKNTDDPVELKSLRKRYNAQQKNKNRVKNFGNK